MPICMCVCVCIYIYIYTHAHIHFLWFVLVLSSHLIWWFSSSVLRFSDKHFVCISFLLHTCYMTHLSNSPWFDHKKFWWVVRFTKRPTVEFSSVTSTEMSSWAPYPVLSYKSMACPQVHLISRPRLTIVKTLGLPFLQTPKPENHRLSTFLNTFAATLRICSPTCSRATWRCTVP